MHFCVFCLIYAFSLNFSLAATEITRELLWPEEPIPLFPGAIRKAQKRLPENYNILNMENMGNDFIFAASPRGSYKVNLYYYDEFGNLKPINNPSLDHYPNLEFVENKDRSLIVWSATTDPEGLHRQYYQYSLRTGKSEIISIGMELGGVVFNNTNLRPKFGCKDTQDGKKEVWANTYKEGWVKIDTVEIIKARQANDPNSFLYIHGSNLYKVDLFDGTRKIILNGLPPPVFEPFNSYDFVNIEGEVFSAYAINQVDGKKKWFGTGAFAYIYADLLNEIQKLLGEEPFEISDIWLSETLGWSFMLKFPKRPPIIGNYSLYSKTISFPLESRERSNGFLKFEGQLSDKKPFKLFKSDGNENSRSLTEEFAALSSTTEVFWEGISLFNTETPIPYFLSTPSKGAAPYPTVLLVHGGPWAKDRWDFEENVQHLTARGYQVLQVNYRGSSTSHNLQKAGFGEYGRGMQEDLYRVLEHLAEQGKVDPDNVAIMGGSYGGYAALLGVTRDSQCLSSNSEKKFKGFKAAIAYCPLTSVEYYINDTKKEWGGSPPRHAKNIGIVINNDWIIPSTELPRLQEISPLEHASKLSSPLLLAHGIYDTRVPVYHSDEFSKALSTLSLPHTYIQFAEGHGWSKPGNQRAWSYLVEAFLAKHLKGGIVEPPFLMDVAFSDITFRQGENQFPEFSNLLKNYRGLGLAKPKRGFKRFFKPKVPQGKVLEHLAREHYKNQAFAIVPYQGVN